MMVGSLHFVAALDSRAWCRHCLRREQRGHPPQNNHGKASTALVLVEDKNLCRPDYVVLCKLRTSLDKVLFGHVGVWVLVQHKR